ncbi:OVARIAN TUMOR DOMAIN-containing deubiquitinating enzyme 3 isoform X1 [Actinidia eriantha]|uniref:OVARIAN TUMOR DOMAIN-containing deubiquitinating enzyme 3 isoform X1 n=1 Tax=Actinidia eriantha TaxID=165200 RepID=UPI002589DB3E|nr:OVARIAN TUMOR DOMAIN-containing deubiquitinating enzyme 3 isoform X1 [Actinidia eriantha]
MAAKPSNETLLEQLKHGLAQFEIVSSPVLSISSYRAHTPPSKANLFFARIGPSIGGGSPAIKKVERFSVQKVTGDGRCLFRALVKGMALNKGITLNPREEREDADCHCICVQNSLRHIHADDLRVAVKEVICDNGKERVQYEEALVAITVEESLKRYCQRIGRSDFWGGESELLVLSKLCCQPITVYIPEHEHTKSGWGAGFIPIAEYGSEFGKGSGKGKARKVVRLLYSGKNHYDLLV